MALDDTVTEEIRQHLGRKPRILIVEDYNSQGKVLSTMFERAGYEVLWERNMIHAMRKVLTDEYQPDIILSDYDNSPQSGDERAGETLRKTLQSLEKSPQLYVGMSNNHPDRIPEPDPKFSAYKDRCDAFVTKNSLIGVLQTVTSQYQRKILPRDGAEYATTAAAR